MQAITYAMISTWMLKEQHIFSRKAGNKSIHLCCKDNAILLSSLALYLTNWIYFRFHQKCTISLLTELLEIHVAPVQTHTVLSHHFPCIFINMKCEDISLPQSVQEASGELPCSQEHRYTHTFDRLHPAKVCYQFIFTRCTGDCILNHGPFTAHWPLFDKCHGKDLEL